MRPTRERLLRKGDYVHGSFFKPEQVDGYINAVNPGDRTDVLGRFPFSTRSVDDAVEYAAIGATKWRRVGLNDRAAAIRRFREQLHHAQETLARLVTRENGKPLWESRQEVQSALRTIDIYLDDGVGLLAPRIVEEISAVYDKTVVISLIRRATEEPYLFLYADLAARRPDLMFWLRFEKRLVPAATKDHHRGALRGSQEEESEDEGSESD